MVSLQCVVLLSAVVAASSAHNTIRPGAKIRNCKAQDLECPEFTYGDITPDYEIRTYPRSLWVGATHTGISFDIHESTDTFMKMFGYITGANQNNQTIDMTAPVLTEVQPGPGPNCESNFTMSFYVPRSLWDSAPQPSDSDVFLHYMPEITVFVKAFDGYASQADYIQAAAELSRSIGDSSQIVEGVWYQNNYDSPYKFYDRRNEVWFIQK